ncbi:hypothetical protein CEXT_585221 [Caerostris extrusa]|uniref:Uncharacterized protein n=1 Tax=Caerostris extrusa TaxID=172846 RepID=A0AAV4QK57_CAEEX|nr:hypothetical protein CEXT_585221 [Caerostris extrusa]
MFLPRAASRSVFCKYRWGENERRPVNGPIATDKSEPCERRLKKFRTRAVPRSVFCKYRWGENEERPVNGPISIDVGSTPTNPFKSNDQNFSTSEERVLDNENRRKSLRKRV